MDSDLLLCAVQRIHQQCGEPLTISASVKILKEGSIPGYLSPPAIRFESGSKLREIRANAFNTCHQLEFLSLPPSLEYIGESIFQGEYPPAGPSLTNLVFEPGSKLVRIDGPAFSECHNLTSICLPASLRQLDATAFIHTGITTIAVESGNPYFYVRGAFLIRQKSSTSLVRYFGTSPGVLIDNVIEVIGKSCFQTCRSIRRIDFVPRSRVRVIRSQAFLGCAALRFICLPSSVERLHKNCFQSCPCLPEVLFASPAKVNNLSRAAFVNCPALQSMVIPASVEVIERLCFTRCELLTSVTFESPSNLKRIGDSAFARCTKLAGFSLPSSVEFVGHRCFSGCFLLTNLTVSATGHLVTLGSLPPFLSGSFAVPDSVEVIECELPLASLFLGPPLVLTFGSDSRLRVFAAGPALVHLRGVFVGLATPTLKHLRSRLEFCYADNEEGTGRRSNGEAAADAESDLSSDQG
jgi:hypothetical protein